MPQDKKQLKKYIENAKLVKKRYEKANYNGKYDLRIAEVKRDIEKAKKYLRAI